MGILVGSTGFVGSHLATGHDFDRFVHRTNISTIEGESTELLVCAGLPGEKWRANQDPAADWSNMISLAQVLTSVRAKRAVLLSTVDVYQPAWGVDENALPNLGGVSAYGVHRAWFEVFFQWRFPNSVTIRLPGLFAPDVRKNFIHDLLNSRQDQLAKVNPESTFQFFDVRQAWSLIHLSWSLGISVLNVSSEPVKAQDIASLFGVTLDSQSKAVSYDMRSTHAASFGGRDGYIFNRNTVLEGIERLRDESRP